MSRIYVPSSGPDSWRAFLADPEKQWRTGYSAKTLAYAWEAADGLPPEVARLFGSNPELLIAMPEHKVPLPGGVRESQNDVFAIVRVGDTTVAATIEGKVNEPFGPTVGEWFKEPSSGKRERMEAICAMLGLRNPAPDDIRYQLLHRTASAVIEVGRFKADSAAMIVHSFSPERMWFDDFARFVNLLGGEAMADQPCRINLPDRRELLLGWVTGDRAFLEA